MRPFIIVEERGFRKLIKTGRPYHYIPSKETVSRDVKHVFAICRQRIAKMLQEYEGSLSFATDAWTSPNQKAYVAITTHFEQSGKPIAMLLDIPEVPVSHSGRNLARIFADVLEEFGICHKVSVNERLKIRDLLFPALKPVHRQRIRKHRDDRYTYRTHSWLPGRS